MKKLLNTALLLFAVLMTSCTAPDAWELVSKDSNIRFVLENKQENLSYSVFYKDGVAMEKSLLGLVMDNCEYGKNAQFVSASAVKDISNAYQLKSGKKMNTTEECREQTFTFRTKEDKQFNLIVRIYNDGVAFRYELPGEDGQMHTIQAEHTEFAVPVNGKAWIHPYDWNDRHKPSYEQYCQSEIDIRSECGHGRGWAFPMLFNTNGVWMMITEAHLDGSYPATNIDNEEQVKPIKSAFRNRMNQLYRMQ